MASASAVPAALPPTIDVVWLKRDARLHDHAPLAEAVRSPPGRRVVILYLYEPDQLREPTVHGSHNAFVNEGLADLDARLSRGWAQEGVPPGHKNGGAPSKQPRPEKRRLRALTVCYADCVETLRHLHRAHGIARLLAHEETGHYASYERDRRVRRWCRENGVRCFEFEQTGVTRRLGRRDDFSRRLDAFMARPQHPTPDPAQLEGKIMVDISIPGRSSHLLGPESIAEIPREHKGDRQERQSGGEEEALAILESFLNRRASGYSKGISSPNSSWSTCSRISPHLAWGHISIRRVVQAVRERQAEIKAQRAAGMPMDGDWSRSLASFLSRMHWRSHFMQKIEMEPLLEKRDLCPAYQPLRRQEGDWNTTFYDAWSKGATGYPFVDACVRCLHRHGWLNFRMRAMIVSFACYTLWLDWKRIAPHLGRLFLDFEPGIHYPQLQMQAGTTGINAMRVYNVTKQGKDQDPKGIFIRKYVPELRSVPDQHIHEPWKMPRKQQVSCKVTIGCTRGEILTTTNADGFAHYPEPIVDEKQASKAAKDKISAVRKMESTKQQAQQVHHKHGSRKGSSDFRTKSQPSPKKRKIDQGQRSIKTMLAGAARERSENAAATRKTPEPVALSSGEGTTIVSAAALSPAFRSSFSAPAMQAASPPEPRKEVSCLGEEPRVTHLPANDCVQVGGGTSDENGAALWRCRACTYDNDKPHAPICGICDTKR